MTRYTINLLTRDVAIIYGKVAFYSLGCIPNLYGLMEAAR